MLVSLVVNHVDALIYSIQILSHLFAYINSTITQMSFTSLNLKDNWYPYMYFYHIRLVCKKGKKLQSGICVRGWSPYLTILLFFCLLENVHILFHHSCLSRLLCSRVYGVSLKLWLTPHVSKTWDLGIWFLLRFRVLSTSLGPGHTELTFGFNWAFRKWRWDWAFRISQDVYKFARALSCPKKKSLKLW